MLILSIEHDEKKLPIKICSMPCVYYCGTNIANNSNLTY